MVTEPIQTPNADVITPGVRRRGISFVVKRERAQTASQGPKVRAEWERLWRRPDNQDVGSEAATIERVRNSSLVQWRCAENSAGLSTTPQLRTVAARSRW